MATSKSVLAVGLIVVLIVTFAAGLYSAPYIFPKAPEPKQKTTWELVKEKGKIVVGCSPDYPPYEFLDPQTSNFTGFEIGLTELVAKRLNLTVEWKSMGFDLIIPDIQTNKIDLGVAGFSVTAKRLKVVQFTLPHTVSDRRYIMLKTRAAELGITEVNTLEDLAKYNIKFGVQIGTTGETEIQALVTAGNISASNVKTYEDALLIYEDLKRGVVDAQGGEGAFISTLMLEAEKKGDAPLVVVFRKPNYPMAFVANMESTELVTQINSVLAELIKEGAVKELKIKWKIE